jgi:hypothetical protein
LVSPPSTRGMKGASLLTCAILLKNLSSQPTRRAGRTAATQKQRNFSVHNMQFLSTQYATSQYNAISQQTKRNFSIHNMQYQKTQRNFSVHNMQSHVHHFSNVAVVDQRLFVHATRCRKGRVLHVAPECDVGYLPDCHSSVYHSQYLKRSTC